MKRFLAATLYALLLCLPAWADSYAVGYVNADGYTWNGSAWQWRDGSLWNRQFVAGSTYTYCGRCYTSAGYYQYTYAGVPYKAPEAHAAAAPDDDATLIAKAVIARDAVRSRITEATYRHQNLISSIQKANLDGGLTGGLPALTHGYSYGVAGYQQNSLLAGTFGLNTSTIYGYAPQSLSQTINPFTVNLDQYFLAAAQLAQGSLDASREANTQFNQSINTAAARAADLSGIAARRDAIVAFSRLLDGPPVQSNTSYQFTVGPGGKIAAEPKLPANAQPLTAGDLGARWNASAQKCAACHSGDKREGGFDVAAYPKMSGDQAAAVIGRLLLPKTAAKHMPKDAEPLSPEEIMAWVQVAAQQAGPKK